VDRQRRKNINALSFIASDAPEAAGSAKTPLGAQSRLTHSFSRDWKRTASRPPPKRIGALWRARQLDLTDCLPTARRSFRLSSKTNRQRPTRSSWIV